MLCLSIIQSSTYVVSHWVTRLPLRQVPTYTNRDRGHVDKETVLRATPKDCLVNIYWTTKTLSHIIYLAGGTVNLEIHSIYEKHDGG